MLGALMIFPGQVEVDARLYSIYVFSVRTEKKNRWTRAIWRHFSAPLEICHLALFVLQAAWKPYLWGEARGCLSPLWRMRGRRSARSPLSVCVDDGGFTKGPSGCEGCSPTGQKKNNRGKNFPMTAHPHQTLDVLLNGSFGEIPRLPA